MTAKNCGSTWQNAKQAIDATVVVVAVAAAAAAVEVLISSEASVKVGVVVVSTRTVAMTAAVTTVAVMKDAAAVAVAGTAGVAVRTAAIGATVTRVGGFVGDKGTNTAGPCRNDGRLKMSASGKAPPKARPVGLSLTWPLEARHPPLRRRPRGALRPRSPIRSGELGHVMKKYTASRL